MSGEVGAEIAARLAQRAEREKAVEQDWAEAVKPAKASGQQVRVLGANPQDAVALPNTSSGGASVPVREVPGGAIVDGLPRVPALEVVAERPRDPVVGLIVSYAEAPPFGLVNNLPPSVYGVTETTEVFQYGVTTADGVYTSPNYNIELGIYTQDGRVKSLATFANNATTFTFPAQPFFRVARPLSSPVTVGATLPELTPDYADYAGSTATGNSATILDANEFTSPAFRLGVPVSARLNNLNILQVPVEFAWDDGQNVPTWAQRRILCNTPPGLFTLNNGVVATRPSLPSINRSIHGVEGTDFGGSRVFPITDCRKVSRLTPSAVAVAFVQGQYRVWVWGWERDFDSGLTLKTGGGNFWTQYVYSEVGKFFARYSLNGAGRVLSSQVWLESAGDTPTANGEPFADDINWSFGGSGDWGSIGDWKGEGLGAINTLGIVGNESRLELNPTDYSSFLRADLRGAIQSQQPVQAVQTQQPSGATRTYRLQPPRNLPGRVSEVAAIFKA